MKKSLIVLLLCLSMVLTACSGSTETTAASGGSSAGSSGTVQQQSMIDTGDLFTDRDYSGKYDDTVATISLTGTTAASNSDAVDIIGSTVTITDEGTYILSGSLSDGMVIVSAEKSDKVQLVLDGVSIYNQTGAAIYVLQADKVFVTLAEGSENSLSNGGSFEAIDDNNIDAVIFSKEDLTLNGSGSLTIESPAGHGVVTKDELTITGGSYTITTASHGMTGKDNVCIDGGNFYISAGKDGIHAENDEDESQGFLYIASGTFDISAEGDGISASSLAQIDGGDFTILTGGGAENGSMQTSDSWGGMGGGRGGMGGMPGGTGSSSSSSEDSTSIKGIKATGDLTINGGNFSIDSADDALHSNASVTVCGGTFRIASGDDGIHADDTLTIIQGSISISESYEGLEGLHILVSGGKIDLVSSDDGLNAAGGTDSSGMGGRDQFGGGMPGGMGGSSNGTIVIEGGSLYINASGDGIDANGSLSITGGYTVVVGPTQGDTATLDYDTSASITGGTFIGTGASSMAQTFSSSDGQGVIAVSVGSQRAGTAITLTDAKGNEIISYTPELSFGVVILSSPDIRDGESYTITVGSASGTFEAN